MLKNQSLALMMAQERSSKEQTKVSKTSKEAFLWRRSALSFSLILPFFSLPPLFKHVFANCQTLFCPSQALHSSQVYSAGGLLQREGLITRPEVGQWSLQGQRQNPSPNEKRLLQRTSRSVNRVAYY